eukprot:CAMPEP_0197396712 /NCGR_PEP_ID=MMETSP1165-20131217/10151_1 /TAXON_ID=284809 /ORGANISM="Chrysocystis fragilis, Strain CCMP3189" /LENGTH=398 /DNA_ID=CAMNT_0042922567 /DNA_START=498 /DNA_END=1690 /DNA_ORIENTATION=-
MALSAAAAVLNSRVVVVLVALLVEVPAAGEAAAGDAGEDGAEDEDDDDPGPWAGAAVVVAGGRRGLWGRTPGRLGPRRARGRERGCRGGGRIGFCGRGGRRGARGRREAGGGRGDRGPRRSQGVSGRRGRRGQAGRRRERQPVIGPLVVVEGPREGDVDEFVGAPHAAEANVRIVGFAVFDLPPVDALGEAPLAARDELVRQPVAARDVVAAAVPVVAVEVADIEPRELDGAARVEEALPGARDLEVEGVRAGHVVPDVRHLDDVPLPDDRGVRPAPVVELLVRPLQLEALPAVLVTVQPARTALGVLRAHRRRGEPHRHLLRPDEGNVVAAARRGPRVAHAHRVVSLSVAPVSASQDRTGRSTLPLPGHEHEGLQQSQYPVVYVPVTHSSPATICAT